MSEAMTAKRLAHWDNMRKVFQDHDQLEASHCANECVKEIRHLREANELITKALTNGHVQKEFDELRADNTRLRKVVKAALDLMAKLSNDKTDWRVRPDNADVRKFLREQGVQQ